MSWNLVLKIVWEPWVRFSFESHLADFCYFFLLTSFFQAYVLHLRVSVRLGLGYR